MGNIIVDNFINNEDEYDVCDDWVDKQYVIEECIKFGDDSDSVEQMCEVNDKHIMHIDVSENVDMVDKNINVIDENIEVREDRQVIEQHDELWIMNIDDGLFHDKHDGVTHECDDRVQRKQNDLIKRNDEMINDRKLIDIYDYNMLKINDSDVTQKNDKERKNGHHVIIDNRRDDLMVKKKS